MSGLRTLVLYARGSDQPDRYATYLDRIRTGAAAADAVYQDSAAETVAPAASASSTTPSA